MATVIVNIAVSCDDGSIAWGLARALTDMAAELAALSEEELDTAGDHPMVITHITDPIEVAP